MTEIQHITKKYAKHTAVNDISFSVKKGEILGLLGPNGAGKTTTMNIMTGYLAPTRGRVIIEGVDMLESPKLAKASIGYLPEIPPVYTDMTVKKYLSFVYGLKGVRLNKAEHLKEIGVKTGIDDVFDRVIKNLSKGYRQRVGLAAALIGNPPVIILDEPTVGLDPKQISQMRELIKELGKEHAVILSSHILSEVSAVCDRVIVINKGKIAADLKTAELALAASKNPKLLLEVEGESEAVIAALRSAHGVKGVTLKENTGDGVCAYVIECDPKQDVKRSVFKTLADRNMPIFRMEKEEKSLEQLFLSLTDTADDGKNEEETKRRKIK